VEVVTGGHIVSDHSPEELNVFAPIRDFAGQVLAFAEMYQTSTEADEAMAKAGHRMSAMVDQMPAVTGGRVVFVPNELLANVIVEAAKIIESKRLQPAESAR
jgi:hypothetical protein